MSDDRKKAAARAALQHVRDGMRLGIGSGSTAEAFVQLLAEQVENGLRIVGVATSRRTEQLCGELGIGLSSLDEITELDLTIDGADEIGPGLALIKGGGGALLREKIVAAASREMFVIADDSKMVDMLGAFPLPVEIVRFGWKATCARISRLAGELGLPDQLTLRSGGEGNPFVTDNGNLIVDASFGRIHDAGALAQGLSQIPGMVEHGLFLGMARRAFIGSGNGVLELSA